MLNFYTEFFNTLKCYFGRRVYVFFSRNTTIHAVDSSVQRPEDKASARELSDLIAAELAGS